MDCNNSGEIRMYVLGMKWTTLCDVHVLKYIKAQATPYAPELVDATPCEHDEVSFDRVVNQYIPFHVAAHEGS